MDGVEFDLQKMNYQDLDLVGAAQIDRKKLRELLTRIVVKCPKDWGDPAKVSTYEKLPMADGVRLERALVAELQTFLTAI